jgi:hypothetical protein
MSHHIASANLIPCVGLRREDAEWLRCESRKRPLGAILVLSSRVILSKKALIIAR